jgi:hypothetical protein
MLDNPKLTARQQQILDLIQTAIARTGAPRPALKSRQSLDSNQPTPPKNTCKHWPAKG